MQAPSIGIGGAAPVNDGEVNLYLTPEGTGQRWFDASRRVIFVNGMLNSGDDHRKSALALSVLRACGVVGVYNKTDGFWRDLGQCITDKLKLSGVQSGSMFDFATWERIVEDAYRAELRRRPGLDKRDFVGDLIKANPATHALYALMVGRGGIDAGTPIYCHSQGNLVTSNALTAVALSMGAASVHGLVVNSYGSPARYWPAGLNRTNNAYTFDPVSWLDLRVDLSSSKVGFKAAHGFDTYVQQDGEFVVNRFRWGSFGMTASMDEDGLAEFCVGLGDNTPRLRGIFDRLESAHWTDSDDVALAYVNKLSDIRLRTLARIDPAFIRQLVRLLKSGWTSRAEKRAIERLENALRA